MVRWRFKRKVVYVLSLCLLTSILLFYVSKDDVEEYAISSSSRDFVLQQPLDDGTKIVNQSTKKQEGILNKNSESRLHIYKEYSNDIIARKGEHTTVLRTLNENITMFIYNPKDDMISSHIKDHGTWEENFLLEIANVFHKHKDLLFLDLGCNIGVYSLFMAKLGAKVISVDPVKRSLELLERSVHKNNLSNRVTLVHNAVSDKRTKISIQIPNDNKGGAHIVSNYEQRNADNEAVDAIKLDDLVNSGSKDVNSSYLINERDKIFIKIDIEGNEERALVGGQAFFQRVNVVGIFMEWMHHRYKTSGRNIVEVLVKNGFLPYDSTSMTNFLHPDQYNRWPENVFWMKR